MEEMRLLSRKEILGKVRKDKPAIQAVRDTYTKEELAEEVVALRLMLNCNYVNKVTYKNELKRSSKLSLEIEKLDEEAKALRNELKQYSTLKQSVDTLTAEKSKLQRKLKRLENSK